MEFLYVDESNLDALYDLNRMLADEEGQLSLFTASRKDYREAFLSERPVVFGVLAFCDGKPAGFLTYIKKFATYLASEVIFIEDIHLCHEVRSEKNARAFFDFIVSEARSFGMSRVELRVLKNYSLDKRILYDVGFNKVEKWDTYRLEVE